MDLLPRQGERVKAGSFATGNLAALSTFYGWAARTYGDPASWTVLQRSLAHREPLRTDSPHVMVTRGTKAHRTPASTACVSHVLDACGVPPRMLRCTRLVDLVNTMDPSWSPPRSAWTQKA